MRNTFYKVLFLVFFLTVFFRPSGASAFSSDDVLLGITWDRSELVSFDPNAGTILQVHTYLNPSEAFRGLAYDTNRAKLYALSQIAWNLYEIDPQTLNIELIGKLDIDDSVSWGVDVGGLAYDPVTDSLYTSVSHWDSQYERIWSELARIDITDAKTTMIGSGFEGFCDSLFYNEKEGQLYGLSLIEDTPWSTVFRSAVVRIDPNSGVLNEVLALPYRTIMGLAMGPDENSFYSWVNSDQGHFYSGIDLGQQTITLLASSDAVDVTSDAMIFKNIDIASLRDVSDLVSFQIARPTLDFSTDTSGCPMNPSGPDVYGGKLTFEVLLKNKSKADITGILVKITYLPDQAVIINALGDGGIDSLVLLPKEGDFSDGRLGRKESASIPFSVCVKERGHFGISADILGVTTPPN